MPRIEVRGASGDCFRTDEPDLHKAGDWLAWALATVGASQVMPAQVMLYPLYVPGVRGSQPDWPPSIANQLIYPVMNLRGLIDRLRDIDKELDSK